MQDERDIIKDDRDDEESEIDLVELAAKLWKQRRTIFIWSGVAAVIGLVVAFSIPREYTTTIKIAPEMSAGSASLGNLSGLAAMAGINTAKQGADAVAPQLYPDVLTSVPFAVELFDVKVKENDTDSVYTVREYLTDHTSGPWWGALFALPGKAIGGVMSLIRGDDEEEEGTGVTDPFRLTKDEDLLYKALGERISADYDTKTFVNTISVTMQDPLVSAMLADTVAAHLQDFITEYRTSKARKDMEYAAQLNEEARKDYYEAQQKLADYLDRNQAISLHSASVTKERLTNEAQLAFSLFNQTSQQLQMAKAKVQEAAPVYAVVQPATVPQKPSKPSKVMILIGWIFLGAVAASAWILYGDKVKEIKSKVAE